MEVEIRDEIKGTPLTEDYQSLEHTGRYSQDSDGFLSPEMKYVTRQRFCGFSQEPIKVIGIYDEESGSRETYYEHEYPELVRDIGEDAAANYATQAGWII